MKREMLKSICTREDFVDISVAIVESVESEIGRRLDRKELRMLKYLIVSALIFLFVCCTLRSASSQETSKDIKVLETRRLRKVVVRALQRATMYLQKQDRQLNESSAVARVRSAFNKTVDGRSKKKLTQNKMSNKRKRTTDDVNDDFLYEENVQVIYIYIYIWYSFNDSSSALV